MNLDFRLAGKQFIKFEEQNTNTCKNEETCEDTVSPNNTVAPEAKPITASVENFLDNIALGRIQMLSTTTKLPKIKEGVTKFIYQDSNVTTYRKNGHWGIEVRGSIDIDALINKLPELQETEQAINSQGVGSTDDIDGDVEDGFAQGNTGDCWVLTGTLALASTEVGKQIIKNAITVNEDGSVTVNFKGIGVSYTISADEIAKHDTDSNASDAYSNGDNDMLVIELAVAKLVKDIANGKVKLDVDPDSYEGYYNEDGSIEGGFGQTLIYYFTGQSAETHTPSPATRWNLTKGLPQGEVIEILQKAFETGNTALAFGIYNSPHTAKLIDGSRYSLNIQGGHALAITNLTQNTVTFVNPWDSTTEYTMTWEEFAKLGIGMLSTTDLNSLTADDNVDGDNDVDDSNNVNDGDDITPPVNPEDDDTIPPVNPDNNDDDVEPIKPDDKDDSDNIDNIDDPDNIDEPDKPTPTAETYYLPELYSYGFSRSDIEKYFNVHETAFDSKVGFEMSIKSYSLKDGITVPWYDGEIKDARLLSNLLGLKSKRYLKSQGLTEEIINKYFRLTPTNDITFEKKQLPAYQYTINPEFTRYNIVKMPDYTILTLFRADNTALLVTINADGTYEEREVKVVGKANDSANTVKSTIDKLKYKK